ncbi:hypothetical protein [Mycolicibacterium vanbaalenii]|uniref:hypothetical protein n=1 Tax=Mycolicibacterium vanbaalenii TaxID=110539 RepID=UPI00132FE52C|nr:hypothetical protein [Mycolicibacterium vanbaalenii]
MTRSNRARTTTATVAVRARFVAAAGLLLTLTACQGQQQEPAAAAPPPPEVRHDTEELARIFPALGTPVSAAWIVWDNTSTRPESSRLKLEWIDAVVQVAPATMDELVSQHESEESGQQPAVQKVLEAELPPGPFLTGIELNMVFGAERRSTRVFLDPPQGEVVLQSSIAG